MAISRRLLNEGERVIVDTRTHIKALLAPLLWLVVLLGLGTYADVKIGSDVVTLAIWVLVAAAIVWFVLRPFVIWATASYAITDRRLITRHGVIVRRGHDIPLARISDVAYEFGPIDRLLGCGTLVISDASTHGQVKLHDIPRVEETQRRLNQLLQDVHDASAGHEGT